MADQIVPLTNAPRQTFQIALAVDGATLRLQLSIYFSDLAGYWLMDVADQAGNPLVVSVPLLTGDWPAANVLAQYGYLGIGSAFVINATQAARDYPEADTLGSAFVLLWSDTAA